MTKTGCMRRDRGLAPGRVTHFSIIIVDGPRRPSFFSNGFRFSANQQSAYCPLLGKTDGCSHSATRNQFQRSLYTTYTRASHRVFLLIFSSDVLAKIKQNEPKTHVTLACAPIFHRQCTERAVPQTRIRYARMYQRRRATRLPDWERYERTRTLRPLRSLSLARLTGILPLRPYSAVPYAPPLFRLRSLPAPGRTASPSPGNTTEISPTSSYYLLIFHQERTTTTPYPISVLNLERKKHELYRFILNAEI